jgi:hypothetical protein
LQEVQTKYEMIKYRFRKLEEHKAQVDKDLDRLKKEHE